MRATLIVVCAAAACGSPQSASPSSRAPAGGPPGGGAEPWTEPAPTEPASAKPAPAGRSGAAADPQAAALVAAHNRFRQQHCAPPLAWSPKLAAVAQRWADHLRDSGCSFGHSGGSFGENLAAGTTGMMDAEAVVAMWYDEIKGYSFKQPGFSMQTGHFTQVVWRDTTAVGCGKAQCKGNDIWVCEYDPPGNWEGQYREQVLPTGCR